MMYDVDFRIHMTLFAVTSTKCGTQSVSKLFDTLMVLLNAFFFKNVKIPHMTKKHAITQVHTAFGSLEP